MWSRTDDRSGVDTRPGTGGADAACRRSGRNRGVALVATLSVLALLMVTALEMNRRTRTTVVSTAIHRDRTTLSFMASSGVHAGMAMLIRDKLDSDVDSVQSGWADPELVAETLRNFSFEDGELEVMIEDELGRIQVNALVDFPEGREFNEPQRILWDRILHFLIDEDELRDDDSAPVAIINSIKDWLDSGDDDAITGLTGAESSYYLGLDPPYTCRNGPFVHPSELLLVKGVTEDLMHAETTEDAGVLTDYITVHGETAEGSDRFAFPGRININTASIPVLAAILPMGYELLAIEMDAYRRKMEDGQFIHDLRHPNWYQNIVGAADLEIDRNLITTSSDVFRIVSHAAIYESTLSVEAVVRREQDPETGRWKCRILNWVEE